MALIRIYAGNWNELVTQVERLSLKMRYTGEAFAFLTSTNHSGEPCSDETF